MFFNFFLKQDNLFAPCHTYDVKIKTFKTADTCKGHVLLQTIAKLLILLESVVEMRFFTPKVTMIILKKIP